ncbi:MAG: hypothetical protein NTU88_13105 [Armatimonadetes bacterium]|nr:hypothetical protein [Armatimonadota bacterium]
MLRVLAVVMLVAFASVMYAAPLPDDPALAKPVTLAVKGEALTDVLKMLQKQTGVRLRVDRDIADQKVTIFVDQKPMKDVMNGLSTVFGYRWSQETVSGSRTYRLWEDEKTRRDRENQRQRAYVRAWEQVDAIFEYMTQFAQLKNDELKRLVDRLDAETAEKHDNETRLKLAAAKNLSTDPRSMAVVGFYQTLPESVMSTIKSGMTVHYDSASAEPEWKMPESVAGQLIEVAKPKFTIEQVDGKRVVVPLTGEEHDEWTLARVNLGFSAIITNDVASLAAAVFIQQKLVVTTPASGQTPQTISTQERAFSTVFSLANERVSMATETSERRLPRKQDGALAAMKASFDIQDIVEETGMAVSSTGAPANRSDILAILHKKLGLQIISDHYSQWCSWTAEKSRNVEEFLPMFGRMCRGQKQSPSEVDWGWDGDYCYLRSMDAAGCDLRETPNRLLRA